MTYDQNPLLDFSDLPRWSDITPAHVAQAIEHTLSHAQSVLAHVESLSTAQASWDSVMTSLNIATEQLGRVWGAVSHCHHVIDSPQWRNAYNTHLESVTAFWTMLGQSEPLLKHFEHFAQPEQWATLSTVRQHIITNALRDFKLTGAFLSSADKAAFSQLRAREAALQAKFSENVLDATNAYTYIAQLDELSGVPEEAVAAMHEAAKADNIDGYKITLQFPSYFPIIQYADNRALREQLYRANVTRASDFGDASLDNTAIMQELLSIRQRTAALLGFEHYSDVSLAAKMAESVPQVTGFLYDLAEKARPCALIDSAELHEFAQSQLGLDSVEAWDLTYAGEKLREQRYAFSEQEVKAYFPLHNVLHGLFHVVQALFGVQFTAKAVQVWHADVQYFELSRNGAAIGGVYLDPYARSGKNAGAWMDEVRSRSIQAQTLQTPVALMVTNFSTPLSGQAATLTHDDIITLFHEMGHALHHILTQVDDPEVSGIRGVEWDAVELPSQFMENFCWDFATLSRMSAHAQTGESLPRNLFDKILAAKNFQSGLQMLRQVEFSLYDIILHASYSGEKPDAINQVLAEIRTEIAVIQPPHFNRFQHSFSHIFAGGYSAGYFSYKWAEVLSADVFSAFESEQADGKPLLNTDLGLRYWQSILAVGGSRPAMDSFKAFMGREPNVTALLRHSGLLNTPA